MENDRGFQGSKENLDKNTEYIPTRCRITKPIPPKPAANPMQFVKITPSKLLTKAHEQIKKAEEVKVVRSGIQDDAEDWQANLDNWKSSRRKRQEHIIERVVEVKKLEQQETERTRRKSKTFHEILEEKGKRRTKLTLPIYDNDDSNDLSDLGLGNSSTKTSDNVNGSDETTEENLTLETEIKYIMSTSFELTDNQKNINEKPVEKYDLHDSNSNKNKNAWEKRQIWTRPDEENNSFNRKEIPTWKSSQEKIELKAENQRERNLLNAAITNVHTVDTKKHFQSDNQITDKNENRSSFNFNDSQKHNIEEQKQKTWQNNMVKTNSEPQYTYESAIQGYRTRVKSNLSNSVFVRQFSNPPSETSDPETNIIVPKGSILKRKELFEKSENEKVFEINSYEAPSTKRLYEDLVNSQSLKERLQSLEKCTAQPLTTSEDIQKKANEANNKPRSCMLESIKSDLEKNKSKWEESGNSVINKWEDEKNDTLDRPNSPETNIFVNKIEKFRYSLENLSGDIKEGSDYGASNYPASNSPVELLGSSQYCDTDREDSGIHTADVSCSVSQADEPVEDTDLNLNVKYESNDIKFDNVEMNDKYAASECSLDLGSVQPVLKPLTWPNERIYSLDNVFSTEEFPLGPPPALLEPPKEKPPPPPPGDETLEELEQLDSARRIKNEIRMKRSSFLGISSEEQLDDENADIVVKKPPDITSFLQRENRLEKQLYKKTQGSYSEAGDSQDSGVELDKGRLSTDTWCNSIPDCSNLHHDRQSSEPYTESSMTFEEDEIVKKEKEIIALVEKEEQWRGRDCDYRKPDLTKSFSAPKLDLTDPTFSSCNETAEAISPMDDEHFEMVQVKHELLQLEQEEMKRQRENLIFRESQTREMETRNSFRNKRHSLEDISNPVEPHMYMYKSNPDYRKSMPELQRNVKNYNVYNVGNIDSHVHGSPNRPARPRLPEQYEDQDYLNMSNPTDHSDPCLYQHSANIYSKQIPRPITHFQPMISPSSTRYSQSQLEPWLKPRHSTGDVKEKFNYNQHWLIQEAEQRRISEQKYSSAGNVRDTWKLTRPEKHLPEAVIQTLTKRVQNKLSIPERNIFGKKNDNIPIFNPHPTHHSVGHAQLHHSQLMEESQDKMLSVSGKKKCSYCESELGRGAAMIIESLCLFYHMECFKCCVCHMQLGDGLMGTDVRVRNNKLHCHNCYSSDDGVKFSCV